MKGSVTLCPLVLSLCFVLAIINAAPDPGNAPKVPELPDDGILPDTRGTEFIFCFTSNQGNRRALGLTLLIGAGALYETHVYIKIPGLKFKKEVVIQKGETDVVELPPEAMAVGSGPQNGTVWVRANFPITVHGVNKQIKSNEGFLALPVTGLGLEYFVASYMSSGAERSELMVTGVMDFTRIQIQPMQRVKYDNRLFNPGMTILVTVNRFQSVQIQSVGDLTGTRIRSDKPISVMSGSTCSLVTEQMQKCDHLVENIPPVSTLGKKFSILPLRNRTTGYVYRVIAARPNTRFTVLGQLFMLAREGLFREFNQPLAIRLSLSSNKPIMVVQYAKGGALDRIGDPFMTIVPPLEQYVPGSVIFNTFDQSGKDEFKSFASVSVTSWDLFHVYLDNDPLMLIPQRNAGIQQQDFSRVVNFAADYWLPLKPGGHVITSPAAGSRFVAYVYGWSIGTSYGFPAVYGLRRLLCTPSDAAKGAVEKDCTGPIISTQSGEENQGKTSQVQPPPMSPGFGQNPGWGTFNPGREGTAADGVGGGDAGAFFPWYTVSPWQEAQWDYDDSNDEIVCLTPQLQMTALVAPVSAVFLILFLILGAVILRRSANANAKF